MPEGLGFVKKGSFWSGDNRVAGQPLSSSIGQNHLPRNEMRPDRYSLGKNPKPKERSIEPLALRPEPLSKFREPFCVRAYKHINAVEADIFLKMSQKLQINSNLPTFAL